MKGSSILLAFACCSAALASDVVARLDLRTLGPQLSGSTSVFIDYTEVGFLSEDLLLISVNRRSFGSVEPLFADTPDSILVVFDVRRGSIVRTRKISVEKAPGSVQVINGGRLALLNQQGLRVCDSSLQCALPIETPGPMFVSPQGTRLAFGGNGGSPIKVIDTGSSKVIATFENVPRTLFHQVIPGEDAFLFEHGNTVMIQHPGKPDFPLGIDSKGNFGELRFLNTDLLACLDHDASEVVLTDLEAKPIWHYKVEKAWRTGFLTTRSGTRFGIYEHGYTLLNSIINFLDIDDGSPQNFQRVRVIDLASGNEVFRLEWDPRPNLTKPALSPSGHCLARVRAGILEVFQVN